MNEDAGKEAIAAFRKRGGELIFPVRRPDMRDGGQATFDKIKTDHGRIDVLVNVAGGSVYRHLLEEFPLAHWQAVIDANLTSTFLCCRAVIGHDEKAKKRRHREHFSRISPSAATPDDPPTQRLKPVFSV